MGACFHVQGVECDNCRTGLNVGPWYDPVSGRWVTPFASREQLPVRFAHPEVERLEALIEDLRVEVRSLSKALADHIAAGDPP